MNAPSPRWNTGRVVGPRTAFTPVQIKSLINRLSPLASSHDLALLMVGVDSMLRAVDLLSLRVRDVQTATGAIREMIYWRQQKTQSNVIPVLTAHTKAALKQWIEQSGKQIDDFLFTRSKSVHDTAISYSTYQRLIKSWAAMIALDPTDYSTHSIRRTKPIFMYRSGCAITDISKLLGHKSTDVTLGYLGITQAHLKAQALSFDVFNPPTLTLGCNDDR